MYCIEKKVFVAKFSGAFNVNHLGVTETIYITKVIYSKPAVVVFWSDGTKTVSKCSEKDNFSPEVGLTNAIFKKIYGNKKMKKIVEDWCIEDGNGTVTLAEVRKKNK